MSLKRVFLTKIRPLITSLTNKITVFWTVKEKVANQTVQSPIQCRTLVRMRKDSKIFKANHLWGEEKTPSQEIRLIGSKGLLELKDKWSSRCHCSRVYKTKVQIRKGNLLENTVQKRNMMQIRMNTLSFSLLILGEAQERDMKSLRFLLKIQIVLLISNLMTRGVKIKVTLILKMQDQSLLTRFLMPLNWLEVKSKRSKAMVSGEKLELNLKSKTIRIL